MPQQLFPGVYSFGRNIATKNSTPGYRVYGEKLEKQKDGEYRFWDPFRSKIGAAILKGLKNFPVKPDSNVLYLGASTGTTSSHIADITKGQVYCVEFGKRVARDLMHVCEKKTNMIPIVADARHPWEYAQLIGPVDVLIQDVAQPRQADIVLVNSHHFPFTDVLLSIKSRSIDSSRNPKKVIRGEVAKLKGEFNVVQELELEPFEKDHVLVHLKRK
ncbi:MAG TPA: fibrillarin-like rRNA/tRNA 2'-O-methyltransferase [Candidatus Altiarchaeales archaeon]|nr:fibrillarin-like rRNA/tRNA 2'-O-methyltransferase [Candidatus Altiarchaeales archaeon]